MLLKTTRALEFKSNLIQFKRTAAINQKEFINNIKFKFLINKKKIIIIKT